MGITMTSFKKVYKSPNDDLYEEINEKIPIFRHVDCAVSNEASSQLIDNKCQNGTA